ncbi:G-protein coupled receptor GRL101-like protein, partial [Leptotrombidium deliense]
TFLHSRNDLIDFHNISVKNTNCFLSERCFVASISSINYPLNYSNNYRGRWLITAPSHHYINLTVVDFDVQTPNNEDKCMFDHVIIIDASRDRMIGKYCNSRKPPKQIISSWNQLQIDFNTDSENQIGRGFLFTYTVHQYKLPNKLQKYLKPPRKACPEGWTFYKRSCYKVQFDEPLQWYEAEARCQHMSAGLDGHLVSILDEDEMKALHHFLVNVWKVPPFTAFYIGLRDVHKEGSFRWVDNNPMSYTDWAPYGNFLAKDAQPDGGTNEDCTIIFLNSIYSTANWHDIYCSMGEHGSNPNNVSFLLPTDIISSYICKMDAWLHSMSLVPREPMFDDVVVPDKEIIRRLAVKERYFICNNSEVISIIERCAGDVHCRDGSDENGCPDRASKKCMKHQFQCDNGACVSIDSFCDFYNDCGDNSDEKRCEIRQCNRNEYECLNGQCIPAEKRCDLLADCEDKSDEGLSCTSGRYCNKEKTFQCYVGTCIPKYAVCDKHRDCPGKLIEDERSSWCNITNRPFQEYQSWETLLNSTPSGSKFTCQSGHIIDSKYRCIYETDEYGYQIGCRDVTHLRGCEKYKCHSGYVKCPDSYCIPPSYLCDGKYDCVGGADEVHCGKHTCPGRYRCLNSTSCILLRQLCDNRRNCQLGDDEWFCDVTCPEGCDCVGLYFSCQNRRLTSLPTNLPNNVRKLDLSYNHLGPDLKHVDFNEFFYLGELILQSNSIEILIANKFSNLHNLYTLDLRYNKIKIIRSLAFNGLQNVRTLLLDHNPSLQVIEANAFNNMTSLRNLNITNTNMTKLSKMTFFGMSSLETLHLSENHLQEIETEAFVGLEMLLVLDIQNNDLKYVGKESFKQLYNLQNLLTDSFKFCCLVSSTVPKDVCWPPADQISDCEDLLSSPVQRCFLWILGMTAIICNSFVIVWRCARMVSDATLNRVSSRLILSLGCSDLLMGIYLIIIACVDANYRGRYIEVSDEWRSSVLCKFCGFLSTIASEASVFTLVSISIDRLICICFPFSKLKFTLSFTHKLIFCSWITAFALGVMPLIIRPYFRDEFYGRSAVCLPLHITTDNHAGWEYSVAIFIGINLLAFLIILFCNCFMYKSITDSRKRIKRIMARQVRERQVGRQMALIVMSNFLCWCPIIIMGLVAIAGYPLAASVYSWTAVFILPLNSATDPILYTLAHFKFASMVKPQRPTTLSLSPLKVKKSNSNSSYKHSPLLSIPTKTLKAPHGYTPLMQYLRDSEELEARHLLQISCSLSDQIKDIHASGYALGGIDFNNVFVSSLVDSQYLRVYLPEINSYHVSHSKAMNDDFASDMEEFGLLVKRMLRYYQIKSKANESNSSNNNN